MRFELWYHKLPLRLRSLFRRAQVDHELQEEIQDHLEKQIQANIARGMLPDEARYAALRAMGNITQIEERCRDARGVNHVESFFQDLRYGLRQLRRNPSFSILAILCLTLGIGANAAVFSWIEGILLRPFPAVRDQNRLVVVVGTNRVVRDKGTGSEYADVSWPDFLDLRRNCTLIDTFIADKIMGTTLNIGDRAERVAGSVVSANYFDALGVRPVLGRGFEPSEEAGRNAHPVTVISYWMWKQRFGGDPRIIGRTQVLNGVPHTIIGVAPEGFYGTFVGHAIQFWVPVSMQEVFEPGGYKLADRSAQWIEGFARLKPGVTVEQAQEEIAAVAKRLEADYPETNRGRGVEFLPLWKAPFNQAGELLPKLKMALVVVFLVLLIACANVSNLLLIRSFARRQEITIRMAIGAGRGRLLKQLLTEGLILATCANTGAILVAYWCRNLLVVFFPNGGAMANLKGELDWRVLALSAAVCLVSTLLFGLVPGIQASKLDLVNSLKSDSMAIFGGHGKGRLRSSLVLVQISLSFALLVGAGLLVQSLRRLRTADPGFSTQNVLTTGVDLVAAGYDAQRAKTFQDQLLDRVRALPGVEAASLARVRPFSYLPFSTALIAVDGYQPAPEEQPTADYNQVSPGYFDTMGIPLLSGRDFTRADKETAPLVAVVNEKMLQQYWRGIDPVGKRFQARGQWLMVIGVARQSKYSSFGEAPRPFFYVPLRQNFSTESTVSIRTSRDPATMASALASAVHSLDPSLASSEVIPMRQYINITALASQQVVVALLGIFGGLALLLAGIGLYGVMSYTVSQSSRELALRMALGARPADLLRAVMSHGLVLTLSGIALGAVAAMGLTETMAGLLYRMSPRDPLAFGSALAVMIVASLPACFLPAWRAAHADPARVLRD